MHGEYTLVFLREPDHGRLRIGMATLTEEEELIVLDPETVALAAGDEKAALVWRRGVGRLPRWTGLTEDEEEKKPVVEEKEKEAQDDVPPKYRQNARPRAARSGGPRDDAGRCHAAEGQQEKASRLRNSGSC